MSQTAGTVGQCRTTVIPPPSLFGSFGFQREWPQVGEVSPVPSPPGVTLVLEELGLRSRRIGGEHELHRRTSHGDLPFAIACFSSRSM